MRVPMTEYLEIDLDTVRLALRGTDYRRGSFETNDAYRRRVITRLEAVEAMVAEARKRLPDKQ